MKWSVYALRSVSRNYIYVGLSLDVERRVRQHDEGREKTTRPYRPFRLILLERFETRAEARRREVYLKSGCG
ncbi:MAG: GIY-YIG nuclease family protein, partial [Bacteroidota bacterium]